ncbi:MAG: hypothetical protein FWE36_00430 [Erysipelotrichales bacterium]|nr:hypothetical protein [Erysipelotrichales bacterium]
MIVLSGLPQVFANAAIFGMIFSPAGLFLMGWALDKKMKKDYSLFNKTYNLGKFKYLFIYHDRKHTGMTRVVFWCTLTSYINTFLLIVSNILYWGFNIGIFRYFGMIFGWLVGTFILTGLFIPIFVMIYYDKKELKMTIEKNNKRRQKENNNQKSEDESSDINPDDMAFN